MKNVFKSLILRLCGQVLRLLGYLYKVLIFAINRYFVNFSLKTLSIGNILKNFTRYSKIGLQTPLLYYLPNLHTLKRFLNLC